MLIIIIFAPVLFSHTGIAPGKFRNTFIYKLPGFPMNFGNHIVSGPGTWRVKLLAPYLLITREQKNVSVESVHWWHRVWNLSSSCSGDWRTQKRFPCHRGIIKLFANSTPDYDDDDDFPVIVNQTPYYRHCRQEGILRCAWFQWNDSSWSNSGTNKKPRFWLQSDQSEL